MPKIPKTISKTTLETISATPKSNLKNSNPKNFKSSGSRAANQPIASSYAPKTVKRRQPSNANRRRTSETAAVEKYQGSATSRQGSGSSARHWLWLLSWPVRWPFVFLWREKWRLICLALLAFMLLLIPSESARGSTKDARFDANSTQMRLIPERDIALVLGAGVLPDHTPTASLKLRIETAVDLYKAGRVKNLLMSGDNSDSNYNEPTSMKAYAVSLGVDAAVIGIDPGGFSTYNSCYRAHAVYNLSSVTVVTQGYHLPRAVMTCAQIGIDTIGVAAKRTGRDYTATYIVREHFATAKAYTKILLQPKPATVTTTTTSPAE